MFRWMVVLTAVSAFAQTPPGAADEGRTLFETHCALCHGIGGKGSRGPSLNRAKLAKAPDDAALKKLIQDGVDPEMPPFWFLADPDIDHLTEYVRSLSKIKAETLTGDAAKGADVYARSKCGSCHILSGSGTGFGPELSEIGAKRSAGHLRESVAKPSAGVPEGFLLVQAKTRAGSTVRGVRVNEDTFTIQIRDAGGQFHSLRKTDLSEVKKLRGESPMPSYASMGEADLNDLVAYLASLTGAGK